MIFIRSITNNKLNTFIITEKHGDSTFICAIGYAGGGTFEEFCGKFHWDDEANGIIGYCSDVHDPDTWEKKICEEETIDNENRLIEPSDRQIIDNMVKKIWAEYLTYDEASETRLIRDKYVSRTKVYKSKDWFPDVVDLVSNYHWGLWEKFDY